CWNSAKATTNGSDVCRKAAGMTSGVLHLCLFPANGMSNALGACGNPDFDFRSEYSISLHQ
ncbi:MAG: hypothetical protein LBV12_01890, partial [Puniceicoccales bacterium]|nr:hypothetical protein [Puniceicoccales bacterium]